MHLYTILKREIKQPSYQLIGFAVVSGIASAMLIGVINLAAETVANNQLNWKLTVLFGLFLCIDFLSKKYVMDRSNEMAEHIVNRIRHRIADKVRRTELNTLEKYGTASIYARISQDSTVLSNTSIMIIDGLQQTVLMIFTLLYIATISFSSFIIIIIGLMLGGIYYSIHAGTFRKIWKAITEKQTQFFEKLGYLLHGFKEIKINRLKNEKVFGNYVKVNNQLKDERIAIGKHFNITLVFTSVFLYLMLGVILFVLPKLHAEHSETIIKVVAATLFIFGPIDSILFAINPLANANNAAGNILELEAQLEEELKKLNEDRLDMNSPEAFKTLPFDGAVEMKNLCFQYSNGNGATGGFEVGPINQAFKKGELIFVTGGNGSGKTTFLRLFTGLYKPQKGSIKLTGGEKGSGVLVSGGNYQQYQNLFSTIFSDYHLFDELYGVEGDIDPGEVNALLESMDLPPDKVSFRNGAFTNINLSSGQRKRLALVTAILEDKAIYVFDEVAADLDPQFRDKFYYEILPGLKERNKTVLVVSHDQQYWTVPDRLLHFQDGMVRELTKTEVKSLVSIAIKD